MYVHVFQIHRYKYSYMCVNTYSLRLPLSLLLPMPFPFLIRYTLCRRLCMNVRVWANMFLVCMLTHDDGFVCWVMRTYACASVCV